MKKIAVTAALVAVSILGATGQAEAKPKDPGTRCIKVRDPETHHKHRVCIWTGPYPIPADQMPHLWPIQS